MAKLAQYGGNSYEANLALAVIRAEDIETQLLQAANMIVDPFELNMSGPGTETRGYLGEAIEGADASELFRAAGLSGSSLVRSFATRNDLAFFLEFMRNDDPSKTTNQIVDEALARRGFRFTPSPNSAVSDKVLGSVTVPMKTVRNEKGELVRAEPAVELTDYKDALLKLNNFKQDHSISAKFQGNQIDIQIAATRADFERIYNSISPTSRDLSAAGGVNFMVRGSGKELTVPDVLGNRLEGAKSKIILNHELTSSSSSTFGGRNATSETLLHEYGHSIHNTLLGPQWGDQRFDGGIDSAYEEAFAEKISDYGTNNHKEHFAESFANYLQTGLITDKFKDYLASDKLGIGKLDFDSIPALLRGTSLADGMIKWMDESGLNGYTFRLDSATSNNETPAQILEKIRDGLPFVFRVDGHFRDSQGREIRGTRIAGQTVKRTFTWEKGKLSVYHDWFDLPTSAQGLGLGTDFIDESFKYYKSIGLSRVTVTAALDNGPYQWALMGFDWNIADRKDEAVKSRNKAVEAVSNFGFVLGKYKANLGSYGSMSSFEVATDIAKQPGSPRLAEVLDIIGETTTNGWDVNDDLLSQLDSVSKLPSNQVTANMVATIGRNNKRSGGKTFSTVGRIIMMKRVGSWSGYKDI